MNTKTILTGAVLATSFAFAAFAHGGATGIVKERMDGMSGLGKTVKALAPMMRGEIAYNAQAVRAGAEAIRTHSGEALTKLFPKGSAGKPSEAKAIIWDNWEEFSALAEQLHVYSEGLALASENGLMMAQSTTGNTGAMMGAGTMVGGGATMMGSSLMGLEELAAMPVDSVFAMVSQTCSACHSKFRAEAK